jgi:hypothetical protein
MLAILFGALSAGSPTRHVVDLQDMFSEAEGSFGTATAELQLFGFGAKEGEQWHTDGGSSEIFHNIAIFPQSYADDYQMKWDTLSGDAPDTWSTPEGDWESLGVDSFELSLTVTGDNEEGGSVTVSIRRGTGSVLDTAVWSYNAMSTKT